MSELRTARLDAGIHRISRDVMRGIITPLLTIRELCMFVRTCKRSVAVLEPTLWKERWVNCCDALAWKVGRGLTDAGDPVHPIHKLALCGRKCDIKPEWLARVGDVRGLITDDCVSTLNRCGSAHGLKVLEYDCSRHIVLKQTHTKLRSVTLSRYASRLITGLPPTLTHLDLTVSFTCTSNPAFPPGLEVLSVMFTARQHIVMEFPTRLRELNVQTESLLHVKVPPSVTRLTLGRHVFLVSTAPPLLEYADICSSMNMDRIFPSDVRHLCLAVPRRRTSAKIPDTVTNLDLRVVSTCTITLPPILRVFRCEPLEYANLDGHLQEQLRLSGVEELHIAVCSRVTLSSIVPESVRTLHLRPLVYVGGWCVPRGVRFFTLSTRYTTKWQTLRLPRGIISVTIDGVAEIKGIEKCRSLQWVEMLGEHFTIPDDIDLLRLRMKFYSPRKAHY